MKLFFSLLLTLLSWNLWANPICLDLLDEIHQARILPSQLEDKDLANFERCSTQLEKEKALCDKGRVFSCHAYAYSVGARNPKKDKLQWISYNKACQKEYPESCFMKEMIRFQMEKKRPPVFLFDQFCKQGSNLACWRASRAHSQVGNYDKTMENMRFSCKAGDKLACTKILALKRGVEEAIEKPILLSRLFLTSLPRITKKEIPKIKEKAAEINKGPSFCSHKKSLVKIVEKEKRVLGKHLAEFFSQSYAKPMIKKDYRAMQMRYLMRLGVIQSFELINSDGAKVRPQQGIPSEKAQKVFKKMKKKVKVYSNRLSSINPIMAIPIIKTKKETVGLISLKIKGIDKYPVEGCDRHLDSLLGLYLFARSKLYLEQLQFNKLNANFLKKKEGVEEFYFINSLGKILSPSEDKGKDIIDSFSSKAFDELIRKSLDKPFFIESDPNSDYAYIAHSVKTEGQIISSGILTLKLKVSK